mmetsp:Transcript_49377/g.157976  ORF Transcript_49377/g.157976 Transcript_49377/m.157976 type:complete len:456 (+) Transcript_49377:643-2010(+)
MHINADGGLVEEDHRRPADEGHGGGELPAVAATEVLHPGLLVRLQEGPPHELPRVAADAASRQAADPCVELQRLTDREPLWQGVELGAEAQAPAHGVALPPHAVAGDKGVTAGRRDVAADHPQCRGLAGPIGAQEAEALSRQHQGVQAAHGVQRRGAAPGALEGLPQALEDHASASGEVLVAQGPHLRALIRHALVLQRAAHGLALARRTAVTPVLRQAAAGPQRRRHGEGPVLDKEHEQHPQRRCQRHVREELAGDFPVQRIHEAPVVGPHADAILGIGKVPVVVIRDVHEALGQAIVGQQHGVASLKHGRQGVAELAYLQARVRPGKKAVQLQQRHGEQGQVCREHVETDHRGVGCARYGEEWHRAVHLTRHREAIDEHEHHDGEPVGPAVGLQLADRQQHDAEEHRHEEVRDVPGVVCQPVHDGRDAGQKLLALALRRLLVHEVHHEGGGYE